MMSRCGCLDGTLSSTAWLPSGRKPMVRGMMHTHLWSHPPVQMHQTCHNMPSHACTQERTCRHTTNTHTHVHMHMRTCGKRVCGWLGRAPHCLHPLGSMTATRRPTTPSAGICQKGCGSSKAYDSLPPIWRHTSRCDLPLVPPQTSQA